MNKEAYLCLSAMLRAREPRMLTADRAARMLEASGFEESAKLLGDCGYAARHFPWDDAGVRDCFVALLGSD